MRERQEILDYGMTFPDVYIDTPFRDENWVLLRCKRINARLRGLMNEAVISV